MYRQQALWLVTALSFFLAGCAGTEALRREVDANIARGNYKQAAELIRKNDKLYGEKNEVLYNLDLGLLYHYLGEQDSSNTYFFRAERKIDELFTKSISQQALSFIINDNIIPYDGEDFEKVMVNVFLALNFAQKGDFDGALVEARKVDIKLREYARQYDDKNTYREDAFIRYITGALYESSGEVNDAFIAYRNAYRTYERYRQQYGVNAPGFLLDDIVRTATLMDFTEEREEFEQLGGKPYDRTMRFEEGTILVITYVGHAPKKEQIRPSVSIPDTAGILHTFQIALPKFVPRYFGGREYSIEAVSATDSLSAVPEVAQDITAIASKALDERLAMIYLKSGGRAVLKFLAAEKAKSELKKNESKLANIFGSIAIDLLIGATEQADTRSWQTLPAQIHLARIQTKPGAYTLRVKSSDGLFAVRGLSVNVRAGRTSFVIVDDVR
ncbi:hypothetical protein FBQ87_06055 [Sphingobacteriales bacterium CHB3]|nr:hypothetical protein [Sphingobacteriales bacterium CHB3]